MNCQRTIRSIQKCIQIINLMTHSNAWFASHTGWITFVSQLYPGRISDKEIVDESNFCQLIEALQTRVLKSMT